MRIRILFGVAGICVAAACSGSDKVTNPGAGNSGGNNNGGNNAGAAPMSAVIDGKAWKATTSPGGAGAFQLSPATGGYLISGFDQVTVGATSLSFSIGNIGGPGTYPLGVDGITVPGGFVGVTGSTGGTWQTPMSGAAGSITITTLTAKRIAGSFKFTATASGGGATGTKAVTDGVFDVPIQGNAVVPTLADSMGSKMSATLNGSPWNGAIVSGQTSLGYLSLSGINADQTLLFTLPQPAATGTYQMNNSPGTLKVWDPNAVAPAGARCCWGVPGDVGTITFTTLTKTRVKGTFSATLSPQAGTAARGQLVIANGTFDIGMYHTP